MKHFFNFIAFFVLIAALPNTSAAQTGNSPTQDQISLVARAIRQDSQWWLMNRLDNTALYSAVILPPPSNDVVVVRAIYTYNGGSPGWISARIRGSTVVCIEYWDYQGSCRPVRGGTGTGQATSTYDDRREIQREIDRRNLDAEVQARQAQRAWRPQ